MAVAMQYGSNEYTRSGGASGGGGISMTLLWTNPAPTSNFSAQTVSLDLSGYDAVCIITKTTATSDYRYWQFGLVGHSISMMNKSSTSATLAGRAAEVTTSGITFSNGYNNATAGAANCVPWYIYGITGIQ